MKKFIRRNIAFLFGLAVIIIVPYSILDLHFNLRKPDNTIFIWGDSQTFKGIDLKVIKEITNKEVYTAADLGNGVYDFLIFTEKVPSNSDLIVSVSKPMQLRNIERDRNMGGVSLRALFVLLRNNYPIHEVVSILKQNKNPQPIFKQNTTLFAYADSIVFYSDVAPDSTVYSEPPSLFERIYDSIPDYLETKQAVLLKGIQRLIDKNCNIIFLDFPYHTIVQEIEKKSPIKPKTDEFKFRVLSLFSSYEIDTLVLSKNKQMMYDLTHLNELGATEVSEFIGEKINRQEFLQMSSLNKSSCAHFVEIIY